MGERYSIWDSPTGNAFRPPRFAPLPALQKFVLGPVLFVIRLPLLALVGLLYVVVRLVPSMLPNGCGPIGALGRLSVRLVDAVFARALLFLLGYVWINESPADLRKMGIGSARSRRSAGQGGSVSSVRGGDVLLCNHVSFVQVLYLASRCSPQFTTVPVDGKGKLRRVGLWGALRAASGADTESASEGAGLVSLEALALEQRALGGGAPIAVFPEGGPTNNTTMLTFEPVAGESGAIAPATAQRTHLVTFKFGGAYRAGKEKGRKARTAANWAPVLPARPALKVCTRILLQSTHALDVRFLDAAVVPKVEEHAAGVEGIAPGALTLAGARELMGSNGMLAHEALASWSARDYIMFEKWTRGGTEVPSFSR
jgi:hypothetical protein